MEDGPEILEGTYSYGGHAYRLEERDSEQWQVFDGQVLLGTLKAVPGGRKGPMYTVKLAEDAEFAPEVTDDWGAALDYLIDSESNSL